MSYNVTSLLKGALAAVKEINSGVLTYQSGSTTVSCSVYRTYTNDHSREMRDAGYNEIFDDLYVLANESDVSSWGLKALISNVTLDGVNYTVGRTIAKTDAFYKIWLRRKD